MHVVISHPSSGRTWTVSVGALIGRGPAREIQLNDPRISTTHAELVIREGRPVLLNRGYGGLRVDGQLCDHVELRAGLQIELAPGNALQVVAIMGRVDAAGEVATVGRQRLSIYVGESSVTLCLDGHRINVGDNAGLLFATLLRSPEHRAAWYRLAEQVWSVPGQALRVEWAKKPVGLEVDYWNSARRGTFRNLFDKTLQRLRDQLADFGDRILLTVSNGELLVHLRFEDSVLHQVRMYVIVGVGYTEFDPFVRKVIATCLRISSSVIIEQGGEITISKVSFRSPRRWLAEYVGVRLAESGLTLTQAEAEFELRADLEIHLAGSPFEPP